MATYEFNPNGALDTADELQFVTQKLENSLSDLMTKVQLFTQANAGNAPDNYTAAQGMWNKGQQDMNASLAVGKVKLEDIHHEYVLGDNRGAAVFGVI
jgi:uncharacterized protein YukE